MPFALALTLAVAALPQDPVGVAKDATADQLLAAAAAVRPSARQLAWQAHGFVAFAHFGMNTFTDREWGEGTESPTWFAPTDLDARQWVETFAQAGMRGVVLTCKHHDGFCLWPTATTKHSVAASPWRDGKGDVVAEVAAACAARGLSFGVYLSPWDRNCQAFGSRAYHEVFQQQLRELCSNYGPLFEVWFDGAHCPSDDPAVFDWQAHFRLVRQLQPMAAIAITGPDVRWVGNEAGRTRSAEWSVLPLDADAAGPVEQDRTAWQSLWRLRERDQDADLGSRARLAGALRLCWWPAETDVSIRPGWFWHERDDTQVKTVAQLLDCWFAATGGNALLLLNVPPDRRGRVADADATVLHELGAHLDATFATDLAATARTQAYSRCGEVYFAQPTTFDVLDLREDVAAHGQLVESFRIDTFDGNTWQELEVGTTIGYRRLLRLPRTTALGVRYWIEQRRAAAPLAHFSVHLQPLLLDPPTIARDRQGTVTLRGAGELHYTLDGRAPNRSDARYNGPFALPRGGTVRAAAFPPDTPPQPTTGSAPAMAVFGLATAGWHLLAASSEQAPGERAELAFDGDPTTHWHSRWSPDAPTPPHDLAIDLGATVTVTGFIYVPRPDGDNGTIADYELQVRAGGDDAWRTVARGTFAEPTHGQQVVRLPTSAPGVRQVRFAGHREVHGRAWASCAEFAVLVEGSAADRRAANR